MEHRDFWLAVGAVAAGLLGAAAQVLELYLEHLAKRQETRADSRWRRMMRGIPLLPLIMIVIFVWLYARTLSPWYIVGWTIGMILLCIAVVCTWLLPRIGPLCVPRAWGAFARTVDDRESARKRCQMDDRVAEYLFDSAEEKEWDPRPWGQWLSQWEQTFANGRDRTKVAALAWSLISDLYIREEQRDLANGVLVTNVELYAKVIVALVEALRVELGEVPRLTIITRQLPDDWPDIGVMSPELEGDRRLQGQLRRYGHSLQTYYLAHKTFEEKLFRRYIAVPRDSQDAEAEARLGERSFSRLRQLVENDEVYNNYIGNYHPGLDVDREAARFVIFSGKWPTFLNDVSLLGTRQKNEYEIALISTTQVGHPALFLALDMLWDVQPQTMEPGRPEIVKFRHSNSVCSDLMKGIRGSAQMLETLRAGNHNPDLVLDGEHLAQQALAWREQLRERSDEGRR